MIVMDTVTVFKSKPERIGYRAFTIISNGSNTDLFNTDLFCSNTSNSDYLFYFIFYFILLAVPKTIPEAAMDMKC